MDEPLESAQALEDRISALRTAVRRAVVDGDSDRARALRGELKRAEQAWDAALDAASSTSARQALPASQGPSLIPLREQVHEALSLLQVCAAPRLIATVHEAFFATTFPTSRLTSLRRDEERSFRTAPFARPYYVCAALTADFLGPSRGLLAVSTWPMERRIIGSLSPRVDFLVAAINIAQAVEQVPEPIPAARALLARFATNVRGSSGAASAGPGFGAAGRIDPKAVIRAAQAELALHQDEDQRTRADAAHRARQQLDDAQQFFGAATLRGVPGGRPTGEALRGVPGGRPPGEALRETRRTPITDNPGSADDAEDGDGAVGQHSQPAAGDR